MKKLYIAAIICNFALLVFFGTMFYVGAKHPDQLSTFLTLPLTKATSSITMIASLGLLFYNIKNCSNKPNYLAILLIGNFFVNPFLSIFFLNKGILFAQHQNEEDDDEVDYPYY